MKRWIALVAVGIGALSACAGGGAVSTLRASGDSWMAPVAATQDLLYISDEGSNDVYVYTWPAAKLTGTLKGFDYPQGECVDKSGDVWVVNFGNSEMIEYAHGGTKPIARLKNVGYALSGCAVDPTTGNLAVTVLEKNGSSSGGSDGYVAIFKKARGVPTIYSDEFLAFPSYCAYDDKGNLYVDGSGDVKPWDEFEFGELPVGKSTFTIISLNQNFNYSGGVQWAKPYVAIDDSRSDVVYEFKIRGAYGYVNGTTPLEGGSYVFDFWIEGSKLIGPNAGGSSVMIWNYPAGGEPVKTLSNFGVPFGAVVSR
jgi:hypothetical protein